MQVNTVNLVEAQDRQEGRSLREEVKNVTWEVGNERVLVSDFLFPQNSPKHHGERYEGNTFPCEGKRVRCGQAASGEAFHWYPISFPTLDKTDDGDQGG